ncbi:MAG: FtsX-like permease family protein [Defluviitaleaceae bacterium]|nr:FtsX-like permease family protein [Defluviitaleaceae bacterium]
MKTNIFLKSVLRQPIRAFILSVLIGAAAFALVARVTEYIIVSGEINRIEGFYRSIGILSPLYFENFTDHHDVTDAAEIVAGNRHVAFSDARPFTRGVMDRLNVMSQSHFNYFVPFLHGLDMDVLDHYFIGQIFLKPALIGGMSDNPSLRVGIHVDELILGDPFTLREGTRVFTNELGQTTTLQSRNHMHVVLTKEEAALYIRGLWNPFEGMEVGESYFFRASPGGIGATEIGSNMAWYLRPLVGEDGLRNTRIDEGERHYWLNRPDYALRSCHTEMVFFMEDIHGYTIPNYETRTQNHSAVTVIGTKDMTAIPRFTTTRTVRLLDTPLYPGGRWLNHEDYLSGNQVAVIPIQFATRRGLRVGETFTLTLHDNPRPSWIDTPTASTWARGIEHWWDNQPSGWWSMTGNEHADHWQDFPTHELELEVVGIYWYNPPISHNFTISEIHIPASLIPAGFGWDDSPQLTGMYSFVLNSPRLEDAFLRETRASLASLGFTAVFLPNGFAHIAAAIDPIRTSLTANTIIFSVASVLVLLLAIFLYIRQWHRSVAIAKALGVTSRDVLGQLFVPVILIWIPAVLVGSAVGWFFALGEAEAVLGGIGARYESDPVTALLGIWWLFVMAGGISLFIFTGIFVLGFGSVRRSVLEQLQGNVQGRRRKEKVIDSGVVPEGFVVGNFAVMQKPLIKTRKHAVRSFVRYGLRHILRSRVKTGLAVMLALLFTLSLGWLNDMIDSTEYEIERLWTETLIHAEVERVIDPLEEEDNTFGWPALIAPASWDAVLATGFVKDSYFEVLSIAEGAFLLGISNLEGFIDENTKTPLDEQLGIFCDDLTIEFAPGFGEEDFVFVQGKPTPVLISRESLERYDSELGEIIIFKTLESILAWNWHDWIEQEAIVIGVYDGGLSRGVSRLGYPLVMPLSAVYYHSLGHWWFDEAGNGMKTGRPSYMTARFTVDPARNRELQQLRDLTEAPLAQNHLGSVGAVPLELLLEDDVIENVILPMERNLALLRVLYPIAIGSAFVLAFGLSLLTMLQNAKNAAILRVLGKSKIISQVALCMEQLAVCTAGIVLGLIALMVAGVALGVTPFALAGVYFTGILSGSAIGAFVISAKAPVELLQVRE